MRVLYPKKGIVFGYPFFGRNITGDEGEYVPPPPPDWNIRVFDGYTRIVSNPRVPSRPIIVADDGQATVTN